MVSAGLHGEVKGRMASNCVICIDSDDDDVVVPKRQKLEVVDDDECQFMGFTQGKKTSLGGDDVVEVGAADLSSKAKAALLDKL